MILIPTDESRDKLKDYGKIWEKIKDVINSDNYDEKYMKMKFNSDNDFPVKKENRIV